MAKARIFIVEDERISAEDIATRLKNLKYDVSGVVSTGREAIKQVEQIKPDLVLVDIKLKGKMDGIEAADRIRSRFSIPVVYLTAYADRTTIQRLKKTQPYGYIQKPVENDELNGVIETALYKHKMEKRLRESEERFRQFFENGPEYCYMISAEGIILDVNRTALNALGYKKKELIGKSLKMIYAPESRQKMKHLLEKWEKTGRLRNEEIVIITKKGEKRTVLLSASSVKDRDGKILHSVSVQRDITERKLAEMESLRAQEALRESEERFRTIVETAPSLLHISDAEGNNVYVSPNCEKITGYTRDELLSGIRWWVHEDDTVRAKEVFDRTFREGVGGRDFEYKAVRKNGELWYASSSWELLRDEEGKFNGVVLQTIDITEHKRVEEALQKSQKELEQRVEERTAELAKSNEKLRLEIEERIRAEEKYQDLVEKEKDIIYTLDDEGNITFANPAVESILGYKPTELMGKHFLVLIPEEFQEKTNADFYTLLKTGEITAETVLLDKKGESHFVEYSSTTIEEDGKVVGTRGIVHDITERKKVEEELEKHREHLEELVEERTVELTRANEQLQKEIEERKRSEEALRESEEKLRHLFESVTDAIFAIDLNGVYTEVNESMLEMQGASSKDEILGRNAFEFVAPHDIERAMTGMKEVREKGTVVRQEFGCLKLDGSEYPIEVSAAVLRDASGNPVGIIGIARDITERVLAEQTSKQAEEALRKSETLLRNTLEAIPDLLTVHDRDLRVVLSNWHGHDDVSAEERDGQPYCYQVYMHRENPCDPCHALEVLKTGKPVHMEKTDPVDGRTQEINVYPVLDESGNVTMVTEHIRDITERKRVEEIQLALYNIGNAVHITKDLKELFILIRQYLNEIIDTTNFVIALYDREKDELSLTYKVDEKDKYTSFSLGRTLTAYVIRTGKSLLATREEIDELTRAGKLKSIGTPSKIWLGVPLKIGREVVGVMTVQSYEDASRYTETDVEILEFVSQQIAVAIERKRAEDQIQRDLKEKEVLLREIHHRVKNNLQVISSLLSLQLRYIKDEEALDMFRESQYRVRSMALVHESLYLSSDLARIDFSEYVRNLGNGLYRSYGVDPGRIALKTKIKDVSLTIDVAMPCGLVINELVSNALKYAFPPSFKEKGKIEITLHPTGKDKVELIVMDNGVGIPDELDIRNTESLGLHLVTILIEDQLHGKITLDRKGGTKFTMKFKK